MTREQLLEQAKALVTGERADTYGSVEDNFARIATLWSAYRGERNDEFTSSDVALMMALVKVARLANNPMHEDSWVDLAGYAACGVEISW